MIGASSGLPFNQLEAHMPSMNESALRARAQRAGYTIMKSRDRTIHAEQLGEYMLVDTGGNFVVLGDRFNASLEQIAEYLD